MAFIHQTKITRYEVLKEHTVYFIYLFMYIMDYDIYLFLKISNFVFLNCNIFVCIFFGGRPCYWSCISLLIYHWSCIFHYWSCIYKFMDFDYWFVWSWVFPPFSYCNYVTVCHSSLSQYVTVHCSRIIRSLKGTHWN